LPSINTLIKKILSDIMKQTIMNQSKNLLISIYILKILNEIYFYGINIDILMYCSYVGILFYEKYTFRTLLFLFIVFTFGDIYILLGTPLLIYIIEKLINSTSINIQLTQVQSEYILAYFIFFPISLLVNSIYLLKVKREMQGHPLGGPVSRE